MNPKTNYDGPWKDTFDSMCVPAMEFLFPKVAAAMDWQRGYEFLDAELQRVLAAAEWGKGIVDRLIKVWLKNGVEQWLLIHLEFQAQAVPRFAERMFAYRCAIFLRYDRQIVSLAVLGDDEPNWRPNEYRSEFCGCDLVFRFPTVKLLDFHPRMAELQTSSNPVAHIVAAHLRALQTGSQMEERRVYKFELIRNLYDLGFDAEMIRKLYRLIDWMLTLPDELEELFAEDIHHLEEEKHMSYVSSIERLAERRGEEMGLEKGLRLAQQTLETCVEIKFGEAGKNLSSEIRKIDNVERLDQIAQALKQAVSLEEIRSLVEQR